MAAEVKLQRRPGGATIPAASINVSGAGLLVRFHGPATLTVGEQLDCELRLPSAVDKALPAWGIGKVAWVDGERAGIELEAASFAPPAAR